MSKARTYIIAGVLFTVGVMGGRFLIGSAPRSDGSPARANVSMTPTSTTQASTTDPGPARTRRPDFQLPDLEGKAHSVSEWDGKVLVVNFWATWCTPCRHEIPFFNKLQARYAKQGVQFVGIALDDINAVKRFLNVIPIDYPVLIGDDDAIPVAKAYGNKEGVLPYTVFIDKQGNIISIAEGGLSEGITESTLKKLL